MCQGQMLARNCLLLEGEPEVGRLEGSSRPGAELALSEVLYPLLPTVKQRNKSPLAEEPFPVCFCLMPLKGQGQMFLFGFCFVLYPTPPPPVLG